MNLKGLIVFSFIFALAAPAGADKIDLTEIFDEDFRDQCDTGSCHAFASVAVLEAAMRRRRRDSEPVYLSDADLFLRTTVINGPVMERRFTGPGSVERALIEGGWPARDLRLALEQGVARSETVPWGDFLRKFRAFRERLRFAGGPAPVPSPGRESAETEYFYGKILPRVLAEREETRRLLAGFTVHGSTFAAATLPAGERARCRAAGKAVKARLMEDLAVRRPAVICLTLDGLPEWGAPPSNTKHCVAIAGYRKERGADMFLFVRNSWGDDRHPEIPEDRFCRIHEVTSIRP